MSIMQAELQEEGNFPLCTHVHLVLLPGNQMFMYRQIAGYDMNIGWKVMNQLTLIGIYIYIYIYIYTHKYNFMDGIVCKQMLCVCMCTRTLTLIISSASLHAAMGTDACMQ